MLQAQRELLWLFLIGVAFLFTLVAFVCVDPVRGVIARASLCLNAVSYTHLTLPTIYSV